MAFKLQELLDLNSDQITDISLPYLIDVDGINRLRRIMYVALKYLERHGRSKFKIMEAWEDTHHLYQWFFNKKADEIRQQVKEQFKDNKLLEAYSDVESYVENEIENLKLSYIGEVDVLDAILKSGNYGSFLDVPGVKTDFSNVEFFCVIALYMASIAIEVIEKARELLDKGNINVVTQQLINTNKTSLNIETKILNAAFQDHQELLRLTNEANKATLESQIAIDHAKYHDAITASEFSELVKAYISRQHRSLAQKRNDKYHLRQAFAYKLYIEALKTQPDKLENKKCQTGEEISSKIVAGLVDKIQAYSDEIALKRLVVGNEIDTITRMIKREKILLDKENKAKDN